MVLPVPGPPERRMILFFGSPPVRSLSSPGIPVGVLALAESAEEVAINLRKVPAESRYHISSDTLTLLNQIHRTNIGERHSTRPTQSVAKALLGVLKSDI